MKPSSLGSYEAFYSAHLVRRTTGRQEATASRAGKVRAGIRSADLRCTVKQTGGGGFLNIPLKQVYSKPMEALYLLYALHILTFQTHTQAPHTHGMSANTFLLIVT